MKLLRVIAARAQACVCVLFMSAFGGGAFAQEAEVRISAAASPASRVIVEVKELVGKRRWSFANTYGNASGLGARINNFAALDEEGKKVDVTRIGNGEYESSVACRQLQYEVDLSPPSEHAGIAHVSWLTGERGVLMLGDLLPRSIGRVAVRINLPAGWEQASVEERRNGAFVTERADDAVFVIGRGLKFKSARIDGSEVVFAVEGSWAFTDEEAFAAITELYRAHREVVSDSPHARVLVSLQSFPQKSVPADHWRAETRGATLNFFSGRQPSRFAALSRLSTAMAHELLHLWVPNGLALDGAYDWFYEGFVEYQSLRTCVRLGIVSHQDYLDAAARAYDRYSTARKSGVGSLIAASQNRWSAADQSVYANGMLVAFLYDLNLRFKSKNKKSMDDVFRELLKNHPLSARRQDGSAAAIKVLDALLGSADFTRKYVRGNSPIDLTETLPEFGLRVERYGARTSIRVAEKLNKEQTALHRKLGYTY